MLQKTSMYFVADSATDSFIEFDTTGSESCHIAICQSENCEVITGIENLVTPLHFVYSDFEFLF